MRSPALYVVVGSAVGGGSSMAILLEGVGTCIKQSNRFLVG